MQKNKLSLLILLSFLVLKATAQSDFKTKGVISYEWKVNNHKASFWSDEDDDEDDSWRKEWEENTPKFSTYYYELLFDEEKSLMKYKGRDENLKKMWGDDFLEDNKWFTDIKAQNYVCQKYAFGRKMVFTDSIRNLNWKIYPDDNRDFAGFSCKKASAVLYDSVYIFAYFTDQIIPSVGPLNINGLPGAILGLTIPRLHISLVGTAFTPTVNSDAIVPTKKEKAKTKQELLKTLLENTEDYKRWGQRLIWNVFL